MAFKTAGDIECDVITNDVQDEIGGNIYRVKGYDDGNKAILDTSRGFPPTREALYRYDVVIISDINRHIFKKESFHFLTFTFSFSFSDMQGP